MQKVQADAALEEGGRYRLLVDAISDYAIYMLDPNGLVVSWNSGARRFKGYLPEEILGKHFSRFYTDADQAAGMPARTLSIALRDGRFEAEGWRVRKDGAHFWAHVIVDPILAEDGTVIGYAKVTRDLTERRKSEAALRLSEERFRHLVQSVTDYAIYMLDIDGRVANWNAGAQKIKGYRPEEIVGEHFSRFYTEEDRAAGEPERGLRIARETGRFEKEGIRVRKDGTHFWANVVIDAVHDDDGRLIGFAKVTRDITERRAVEQRLMQANEELLQSQKMEAIGRLTGGVAHDFNNLLMAITGSLELLRKNMTGEPRLLRLVDNAMQGARRGISLTQRMLAFARRQDLAPKAVRIPALVEGMAELLARSLGPDVEIETRFPAQLSPILIDGNQFELALLNLAVNARDAMPEGGGLTVSAAEADGGGESALAPGRYVRVSVTDTGTGMNADTLTHATEPFFTTKGVGKGTGLGLAMVRGLIEQSGGAVTLESELGAGTSVHLWIPVSDETALEPATMPASPTPQTTPQRSLKVLVVDDDALVAMNTTAMLEDLGHSVVEVHSGAQALAALDVAEDFDLLITDQAMPQMTGTQLIAAVRTRHAALPVVLATGYAELPIGSDPDIPRLGKPFFQDQLEQMVRRITPPIQQ